MGKNMGTTLFSVIKGNIECALCKEKKCPVRYEPNHEMLNGSTMVACKKHFEKRSKRILKKKLP